MKKAKKIYVWLLFLVFICFTCIYFLQNHFNDFFEASVEIEPEREFPVIVDINYQAIEKKMLELIDRKEYKKVIKQYSKFITTDNRYPRFYNALGFACVKLKKYETAYYAFKRAYRLDSEDFVVLFNLISMAYITGNYLEANQLSKTYLLRTKDNPNYRRKRELVQEVYRSIDELLKDKGLPEGIPPWLKEIPVDQEILYA